MMRKTSDSNNMILSDRLAINTKELQSYCGCGRDTAIKIGLIAKAKIQIGRRVLWNVEKVQEYLNNISEGE